MSGGSPALACLGLLCAAALPAAALDPSPAQVEVAFTPGDDIAAMIVKRIGQARIWLDGQHAAAHDKVIILDGGLARAAVITGSYNFTGAAQSRNAENVVVVSGSRAVTDRFVDNFEKHRRESSPWR